MKRAMWMAAAVAAGVAGVAGATDWAAVNRAAWTHSLKPITAGKPCWNTYARAFIHPPVLEFAAIDGAKGYRFEVTSEKNGETFTLRADAPTVALESVWAKLPVGYCRVRMSPADHADCVDAKEKICENLRDLRETKKSERRFYKAACFKGPYPQPADRDYAAAARRCLGSVLNIPHVRAWRDNPAPDPAYTLYCYPAKILSSIIDALVIYSRDAAGASRADALTIARNMADWLIAHSQPAGAPLAFFPPTYHGAKRQEARDNAGRNMLVYPTFAALAYWNLYQATGETKYRAAFAGIAETMKRLQLPNGSWHLLVNEKDGSPVTKNHLMPRLELYEMLDLAARELKDESFRDVARKAEAYAAAGPAKTWNWEGQYEDQTPAPPYKNLTKDSAIPYAIRLLERGETAEAIDIVDWCEDQFVVWSDPLTHMDSAHWKTPTALEQYNYYTPIDASMATMMRLFVRAYARTRDPLHLEKARALGDNLLRHQRADGTIPTYFDNRGGEDWINCMVFSSKALLELAACRE